MRYGLLGTNNTETFSQVCAFVDTMHSGIKTGERTSVCCNNIKICHFAAGPCTSETKINKRTSVCYNNVKICHFATGFHQGRTVCEKRQHFTDLMLKMDRTFIKVCLLIIFLHSTQAGMDLTLQPEAFNTTVVVATVAKLNELATADTNNLQPDSRFMRRIAWVETEDGTAPHTYSDLTYHGGIWRVDSRVFEMTKHMFNMPVYSDVFKDIEMLFCIKWSQTIWEDCRKPLYSALAARLFFHSQDPTGPLPVDLTAQAQKWESEYHDQPTDTAENFILKVEALENAGCRARGFDLVFVLDGSGSVGEPDFVKTKNFVLSMVEFFNIAASKTRVGVIQYGRQVNTEFHLNDYFDNVSLKQAIEDIIYMDGPNTFTALALEVMGNTSFLPENGGRVGIPHVSIVITDGKSNDIVGNVTAAANNARAMGIVIFAIGVTSSAVDRELNDIGNKPNATYVFHVEDFDAISTIASTLEYSTCDQAAEIQNETVNGTVSKNEIQNFHIPVMDNDVQVGIEATDGDLVVYVSTTTSSPNDAHYDYRLVAREGQGEVSVTIRPEDFINKTCPSANNRKRRQAESQEGSEAGIIGTIYVTIEGLQETNDFMLTVTEGDFVKLTTTKPPTTKPPTTVSVTEGDSTNGCGSVAMTVAYILLHAVFIVQLVATALY